MKLEADKGIDDEEIELKNTKGAHNLTLHLGAFILSISKRITEKLVIATNGFKDIELSHTDSDFLYMEKTSSTLVKKMVGKNASQKNSGDDGVF